MARLVAEAGSLEGQVFPVEQGVTLGREKHNSIPMPANRAASREHCKVWREGPQRFSIADFGSTNGTLVNDEKVVRQTLSDGDLIRIGEDLFRFELDEEDKPKRKAPKAAEARPDLAAVLKGESAAGPPRGNEPGGVASMEVKQRVLHYHKKSRRGSVLSNDMGQMAGLSKWILVLVALGLAVGGFLAAQQCTVKARQAQELPPAEVPPTD